MTEESENKLLELLKRHLSRVWSEEKSWTLSQTTNYGRAVFASRDIQANEVIFYDLPLLIGPIGNPNEPVICVACYKILEPITLCVKKCGLPMCSECPNKKFHQLECELIITWQPRRVNEISFTKIKFLTLIRSLFLSEDAKKLMYQLQRNDSKENLIDNFKDEFDNFPRNDDVLNDLNAILASMNTNAFKILINLEYNKSVSVKGLYPLTCLMNHSCTPNTRHDVNEHFLKKVSAVRKISRGEELLTTYSQILWSTNTRRMHLALTKQFWCRCDRCADPTENDTFMSGLRCTNKTCNGVVLVTDPLSINAPWRCNKCEKGIEYQQILKMQDVIGSMVKNFFKCEHSAEEVMSFIEKRLSAVMPITNQFVVEAQLNAIEYLGDLRRRSKTNKNNY